MKTEELRALIWLSAVTPTGSVLAHTLLKYFERPQAVYEADEAALRAAPVEWGTRLEPLLQKNLDYADRVLEYCANNHIGIAAIGDHFYPQRLRALLNAPLLLYYLGNFCDIDAEPCVSVVGTRKPSPYGERATKRLCVDLSRGGATLVSGLALGVDGLCHRAALYCENFTIAVLGCGIDRTYPPEHRDLMAEVCEKGLVVTEYAPGTAPNGKYFPQRNRIIAALGAATLVTEAGVGSGALITAEYAMKLKRPLYTVPGSIFSSVGAGSNHLLRCGAKPVLRAEDLLASLAADYPDKISVSPVNRPKKKTVSPRAVIPAIGAENAPAGSPLPPKLSLCAPERAKRNAVRVEKASILSLTEEERELIAFLTYEPKSVEVLCASGYSASRLMQILSSLELKGYAERKSGGRFCLRDDAE